MAMRDEKAAACKIIVEPGVSDPKCWNLASFWHRPADSFLVPVFEMEQQVHAPFVRIAEAKCLVEGDPTDAVAWEGVRGVKWTSDSNVNGKLLNK